MQDPMVVFGDFNCMLSILDKRGGLPLRPPSLSPLLTFSNSLHLIDIGFTGPEFTWSNRHQDSTVIDERLDRFLLNDAWLDQFPESSVTHLDPRYSDHSPILLRTQPPSPVSKKLFRFDCRWVDNPEVTNLISHSWVQPCKDGSPMFRLADKLKRLRHTLFDWCRGGTSNTSRILKDVDNALVTEYAVPSRDWAEIRRLELLRSKVRQQEEIYWKQKAKINWLTEGDRNTKFFHRSVSATRKRNHIGDLRDSEGNLLESEKDKGLLAANYFHQLFSSEHDGSQESVFELGIPSVVTTDMNRSLLADVTGDEIRRTVFSIGSMQAPGPDGFTGLFFQRYWDIIGSDVIIAVRDFFRRGNMLRTLNHTWLTLIPKVSSVENMAQVRPIGLCTVFYKIISKIITARLGLILPHFVSPAQNGFVRGRCITDNILIAHELIHHLQNYTRGKLHFMALKVDMEKAYDRVEWDFLFPLLHALGFDPAWISLVHECLVSTTMKVILNGTPHGFFAPTRGLRQGDPLSPLLFAICTEGLSHLLLLSAQRNALHGIKLNAHCPMITHLMFADDTMLFLRVSRRSLVELRSLFNRYQLLSGQRINYAKSSVLFSKNVPSPLKREYSTLLGMNGQNPSPNYLGAPCVVMRSKKVTFAFLQDKITTRLQSWKRLSLSPAGVHTLLTSVISGLPVHIMSCYRVSNEVCKDLDKLMVKFWWGEVADQKRIRWRSWEKLCLSQEEGGLGFRSFQSFNQALLAKQSWRILTQPELLISRLYKGKYFQSTTFLKARKRARPSNGWQGILHGRDLLLSGLIVQLGSHPTLSIFERNWVPGPRGPGLPVPRLSSSQIAHIQISALICDGSWNLSLLRDLFEASSVQAISSIPIPVTPQGDKDVWFFSPTGQYSTSSGYALALRSKPIKDQTFVVSPMDPSAWRAVWSLRIQPKLRFFLWRLCHRIIPTIEALNRRGMELHPLCPVCLRQPETLEHLMFKCTATRRFFATTSLDLNAIPHTHPAIVWRWIQCRCPQDANLWVLAWWRIWKSRNWVVFEKFQTSILALNRQFTFDRDKLSLLPLPTAPATALLPRPSFWLPPQHPRLKINVDGAVLPGSGGAVGLVVRDSAGGLLFATGISYPGLTNPFILELLAARDACVLCRSMGWTAVDIEGDATQVLQAISNKPICGRDGGAVVRDIWFLVESLPQIRFQTVPRQSNTAAHCVARHGLRCLPSHGVVNLSAWADT
ncbi:Transposon TX1 uncharacterized 149 kDa protein [Linum perenne]